MPHKDVFVTDVLYNWISQFKISCTNVWRRNSFWDCYLNNLKQFWHIWPWWQWPLTPKCIGFFCCPGRMCGQSLRKVGQGVLELLIRNEKVTDGSTDLPTDQHVQSNMPSLLRGGHKNTYW